MQHERRPCSEKRPSFLPSFWGKKGGILKRLSFVGVQRRVIPSTRAFTEPRASMPLDLSDDSSSSEDDDERRLGGGDASTSSIARLRARLRLEKEKKTKSGSDGEQHAATMRREQQRFEEERAMLKQAIGTLSEENARLMEEMKTMKMSSSSDDGNIPKTKTTTNTNTNNNNKYSF